MIPAAEADPAGVLENSLKRFIYVPGMMMGLLRNPQKDESLFTDRISCCSAAAFRGRAKTGEAQ